MSFRSPEEVRALGLTTGTDCRISSDARFFGADRVTIGQNVRIDAFCVISAGGRGSISIADHVHISAAVQLFGDGRIQIGSFVTVSSGAIVYSASDDFSGEHMVGPQVPSELTSVDARPVRIDDYSAVGARSLVFPGVHIHEGAVLGAGSMTKRSLDEWTIYAGTPCRPIRARERRLRDLAATAQQMFDEERDDGE